MYSFLGFGSSKATPEKASVTAFAAEEAPARSLVHVFFPEDGVMILKR